MLFSKIFGRGSQIEVIHTNLSKAFDRINHEFPILKLDRLGFSSCLLSLLLPYLLERKHFVAYSGCKSSERIVGSGVGPLLFCLTLPLLWLL